MKKLSAIKLQKLLLQALAEQYSKDSTTPGLVISYLSDKNLYYVSICRYEGYMSAKKVLCKSEETTLTLALLELIKLWAPETNKLSKLNEYIKENNYEN